MKKRFLILMLLCPCLVFSSGGILNAQPVAQTNTLQEGRYVIAMQAGRAVKNTRIPALVLDSYRGIVWTCQNLQDGNPLWVMVDLAKMGKAPATKKKYVVRMLEWQDADLRMLWMLKTVSYGLAPILWTAKQLG